MELTQQDYDTRKARVDKGEGDDEDARLVKHYETNGFTAGKADTAKPDAPGTAGASAPGAGGSDTNSSTDNATTGRSRPTSGRK